MLRLGANVVAWLLLAALIPEAEREALYQRACGDQP